MYRVYRLNGAMIAETADGDMLARLVIETAGALPPRFWVAMATERHAVCPAVNDGYTHVEVWMEAF